MGSTSTDRYSFRDDSLLRMPEVVRVLGVSRTTLFRWRADGTFPAPRRIGPRATAWRWADVRDWIESRPSAADAEVR